MQVRLFIIVAACMGVLYLITEAAKPSNWSWFFGQPPAAQQPNSAEDEVDTRLSSLVGEDGPSEPGVVKITDPLRSKLDEKVAAAGLDPVERSLIDGWAGLFESTPLDDRRRVAQAFSVVGKKEVLPADAHEPWKELLGRFDAFWQDYADDARKSLKAADNGDEFGEEKPLTAEEREAWEKVLQQVVERWQAERSSLMKLAGASFDDLEQEDLQRIEGVQRRWERLALAAVRDDTVHRPAEADAWFRLLDVLQSTPAKELERQPAEEVSYIQLFRQPNEYRGKLVRFKGRIMQVKSLPVAPNVYGIKQQYQLTLRPEDGPDEPVIVYSLELPEGFPLPDDPQTRIREDAEVTGYFFKRWAYLAQDGIHTAPLVLAKSPTWNPGPDMSSRVETLPSAWVLLAMTGGALVVAIGVAVIANWLSKSGRSLHEVLESSPEAQEVLHRSLENPAAGPSVLESLKMLEDRDQSNGAGSSR